MGAWRDRLARRLLAMLGEKEALWLREQNERLVFALNRLAQENDALERGLAVAKRKWLLQQARLFESIQTKKDERNYFIERLREIHHCEDPAACELCGHLRSKHPFGPRSNYQGGHDGKATEADSREA